MNNRTTIMIALLAVVMMIGPASAAVTNFTVSPTTTTVAGATSNYTVQLNTTGFNSLNMTIPAGLEAVVPAAEQLVARVDLWGADPGDYINVTFTANSADPSTKVDVCARDADSQFDLMQTVSYSKGASMVIKSPKDSVEMMNLTLPTASVNGSLELHDLPGEGITNMTVTLYSMKNPTTAGNHTFVANGTNSSVVTIIPGAPYKLWINASNPAPGVDYADVEVEVHDQCGNLNVTSGNYSVGLTKNGSATITVPNPNTTVSGKCTFNVSDSVNEPVLLKALNSSLQTGEKVITFSSALHHLAVTLDDYALYANTSDSATMTVQLKDENDQNLYASGTTINIFYANGTLLAVTPSSNQTDDNGQALFTVTAKGVAPATTTITMSESGGSSGDSATITFKQAPNAGNSVFTAPTSIKAGKQGIITATLKDYSSALIKSSSEFPVTFNMTSGDGYFTDSAGTANYGTLKTIDSTDANGNASIYVYSENASTTLNVNATVVNETGGDGQIGVLEAIGVDPSTATNLTISPSTSVGLSNEVGSSQVFNISVKDAYGNHNLTDGTIIVTTDNEALGNMTNTTTRYDNNLTVDITDGNASFTYYVNNTTPGTAHLALNTTAPAGIPDVEITILTSGPTGVELTFNKTLPLTGTGVEAYAQLTAGGMPIGIEGKNLTFSVSNATGMLEYGDRTTNVSGIATYTFSEATAGVYTVRAKNSTLGLDVTGTITFVGPVDHLVASVNDSTPTVGSAVNVTATVYDANNAVTSGADGASVDFWVSGEIVGTDTFSNGVASITYTSSTAGLVDITAWYIASVQDSVTVTFTAGTDLTVESITPNCGGYLFGNESNNISAVIKNIGDANAGASHACIVLSDGHSETVTVSALAAGASETVTITDPTIRNAGAAVTITVTADCNGEVTETNETNNVTTKDVTVVNNGYKGKTYTGGSNMTTVKSYDLNGNLVYSVGDSYYRGGSDWTAYDVAWTASDLPVTGTVREARLYVTYTWDKKDVMPGDVSMSFNGAAQTQDAHYLDRKGYDGYDYPYGMLTYNVTDDFDTSGNYANLTNSHVGGDNVSMRGMMLVVVYEDASEPRRLIYLNEEFDLLYGGSGKCTTPEEATAWAPITGSINTTAVTNATLITVAPGAGDPSPNEGELIFNGQVWTDVWNCSGNSQIGIDERDVTSDLKSTNNLVGFRSSGDYMEASNAFLVVEYKEVGLPQTGDINNDENVTMSDAVYLAKHVVGRTGYETIYADGDINNDGNVTMSDAVYLAKHVVGRTGYETIY